LLLELGEDLGEDVEASRLVGADDDLALRNALHFGQGGHHRLALLDGVLGVFLKRLAGAGEGDLAAGTVEQLGADLLLERADLSGDCRLRAEALLRRAREAGVLRDLEEPRKWKVCFPLFPPPKSLNRKGRLAHKLRLFRR
jgi:hypothetical protein